MSERKAITDSAGHVVGYELTKGEKIASLFGVFGVLILIIIRKIKP